MRALFVKHLKPGLVLGRPLLDATGGVLLNRGVTLNEKYIQSLHARGFEIIYIRDDEVETDVEPDDDLSPETRARALSVLQETFSSIEKEVEGLRNKSIEAMAEACSSEAMRVLIGSKGPVGKIMEVIRMVLDDVLNRTNLAGLATISSADAKLHDHSINVCVVSVMIARAIGIQERFLRPLAAGCLLHDLGMVFVEPGVDERRRIKQHTLLGYELLRNNDDPDIMAPHVALEHHEHQDGTGLPRGTRSSNAFARDRNLPPPIPTLIGEIAAVANTYDRLLNGRDGLPPLPPDEVIGTLKTYAGTRLNRAVVSAFLRVVPVYPVGAEILVRSEQFRNYTGVVSAINLGQLDRPVIVLTRDNTGRVIPAITVDLKTEESVEIRCRMG